MIEIITSGRRGVQESQLFLHIIYYTLIDISEQLMSQRPQIVPPDVTSSDALQAYGLAPFFSFHFFLGE